MKSVLLATGLFCLLVFSNAVAEPIRFTFNPADSLTCTGRIVTVRTSLVDDIQGPTDTITIANHLLFTRTGTGYELLSTPDSITVTRDGQRLDDPVTSVLAHTPITYVLDSNGQAVTVRGFENVLAEVSADGKQLPENLQKALDVSMLNAGALTEWDTRVGSMVGMELRVGKTAHSVKEHVLPDGRRFPLYQVMKITDTFQVNGHLCARLYRIADTDIARMADKLSMTLDSLKRIMKVPSDRDVSPPEDEAMSWNTDQVVMEVNTMMILGEHSESESVLPVTGQDGKPHRVQLMETSDKEYTFGARAPEDNHQSE